MRSMQLRASEVGTLRAQEGRVEAARREDQCWEQLQGAKAGGQREGRRRLNEGIHRS